MYDDIKRDLEMIRMIRERGDMNTNKQYAILRDEITALSNIVKMCNVYIHSNVPIDFKITMLKMMLNNATRTLTERETLIEALNWEGENKDE